MTRGVPFKPGNKFGRGRPPGSRNKKSRSAKRVIEEYAEAIARKALARALEGKGDPQILKALLTYVLPQPKDWPIEIGALPTATMAQLDQTSEKVLDSVGAGELNPNQAKAILPLLEERRQVIEIRELHARVDAMEQKFTPEPSAKKAA